MEDFHETLLEYLHTSSLVGPCRFPKQASQGKVSTRAPINLPFILLHSAFSNDVTHPTQHMLQVVHSTTPHPLIIKGSDLSCSKESCLSVTLRFLNFLTQISSKDGLHAWSHDSPASLWRKPFSKPPVDSSQVSRCPHTRVETIS